MSKVNIWNREEGFTPAGNTHHLLVIWQKKRFTLRLSHENDFEGSNPGAEAAHLRISRHRLRLHGAKVTQALQKPDKN